MRRSMLLEQQRRCSFLRRARDRGSAIRLLVLTSSRTSDRQFPMLSGNTFGGILLPQRPRPLACARVGGAMQLLRNFAGVFVEGEF